MRKRAVTGKSPTVLVTDAGLGSAISILRSLGRAGYRVVAADSDPRSIGFRSRYVAERVVYPCPEQDPDGCVEALHRAAGEHMAALLVPVTDAVILPLSLSRDRFDGRCRLALPDQRALTTAADKAATVDLARRLGVPAPQTHVVYTVREAREVGPSLGWPVVLKPQTSRRYREHAAVDCFTVCYAGDADQLAARMERFEGCCPVLLQEYYSGAGYGVELLLHEGRPLAAFQHRRLREVPVSGGASALRESVPLDPILFDHAARLLRELSWTGLAMVEFKVGSEGPKLMEINGRVWGSLPLAVRSGMDFPARLAGLYLQGPPAEDSPCESEYRTGVRARNLSLDLIWIASVLLQRRRYPFLPMPGRRAALGALADLLNPACKSDNLVPDDLRPGLAELTEIAGRFRDKLGHSA